MASSVSTTTNGMVVITHLHPAGNTMVNGAPSPPYCMGQLGQVASSMMVKFREGHPKALGTVQIMIGLMSFTLGIIMIFGEALLGTYSGIFVWGAAIYIIAGSLTIAADKNLNKCLVNASLGMNIVATLVAFTGTILHSIDSSGVFYYCYYYYEQNCQEYYQYMRRSQGVSGVLAVFSVLEFIVSIYVSSFAGKAVCCTPPEQVFIIGNHLPQGSTVAPQTPYYEAMRYQKAPEEGIAAHPPQYIPANIPIP